MSDSVRPHRRQPTRLPVPGILQARIVEWVAISFSGPILYPHIFFLSNFLLVCITYLYVKHIAPCLLKFCENIPQFMIFIYTYVCVCVCVYTYLLSLFCMVKSIEPFYLLRKEVPVKFRVVVKYLFLFFSWCFELLYFNFLIQTEFSHMLVFSC